MEKFGFMFIGRSGCGKGTQAKLLINYLEEKYGKGTVLDAYAGKNIRKLSVGNTYTSKLSLKLINEGNRHPDFLANWGWAVDVIEKMGPNMHLILDGSPRSILEAELIDEAMAFYEMDKVFPILIDLSREISKERMLSRKRDDDKEDQIEARLDYYDHDVVPTIEYFKSKSENKIVEINGNQPVEKVHQDILKAVFNATN
ncbi:MAG: hypothetical protein COU71_00710 [Parcubacteria group bacterium CG10_big_fil_rev_8_21_14_0_10_38_31]|nr:MAG: hypothetical protein COU71_00710 [Parcubacteria group bacterium CG10_big_fil_rev_8_21_14_0_10_38_31]